MTATVARAGATVNVPDPIRSARPVAMRLNYTEAEEMRRSEDMVEGPRAFAEKRKPNWKAR